MKKALVIILLLLFAAGIYFNFMHTGSIFTDESAENTSDNTEVADDQQETDNSTAEENNDETQQDADNSNALVFNDAVI